MQYKFKKPFVYGNETIETVELREEFNAGDMIRVANAKGDGDKTGVILCAATGWPLPKVSKMSFDDACKISEITAGFFEIGETDGPET